MGTASFDYLHFLMKLSPDLLSQYAKHHGVSFKTKIEEGGEKMADEFMLIIQKETEDKQAAFWGDAQEIDDIGTENGCDYLITRAVERNFNIDDETYTKLKNSKERSLFFYLNFPELFSETRDVYNLENLQGWRAEKTISKTLELIIPNINDFKEGLKGIYAKEYKAKHLKVKHVSRGDTVTFVAYIEDALTNDLSFSKGDLNSRTPRKPVFMAYFLYRPSEGILEVKAKGGKKRIEQLQKAFIQYMLMEKDPEIKNAVRYNFDKVRDIASLRFPTSTQDLVESATLKGLRIVNHSNKKRISIDIANSRGSGTEPMSACLNEMAIDLMDYELTQFKIEIIFKDLGKGKKRKITTTITYPNICDLKERDIDFKVRRLLKKWGLDLF